MDDRAVVEKTIHDHKFPCDDLWRYEEGPEEFDDDEPAEPWEIADPSCIECGSDSRDPSGLGLRRPRQADRQHAGQGEARPLVGYVLVRTDGA